MQALVDQADAEEEELQGTAPPYAGGSASSGGTCTTGGAPRPPEDAAERAKQEWRLVLQHLALVPAVFEPQRFTMLECGRPLQVLPISCKQALH